MMKQQFWKKFLFMLGVLLPLMAPSFAKSSEVVLVDNAKPVMTIVVAKDAPKLTSNAVEKLVHYVNEISGAKLSTVNNPQEVKTPGILWVGAHEELNKRYPKMDFTLTNPEETLIQTVGKDLVIMGRDKVTADGTQIEAGTYMAVSSFIEGQLGVRWLWPGKMGTDIPKNSTISIAPASIRYTPQIHLREIRWASYRRTYKGLNKDALHRLSTFVDDPNTWVRKKDEILREWMNNHRGDARPTGKERVPLAGSMFTMRFGHGFGSWYKEYGKDHPDWFAMQPDGTRDPYPSPRYAKMDVSNPEVAEQWVTNAKKYFGQNPELTGFAAGVNDHGWDGYCVGSNCLAWDNKNAETLEQKLNWKNESKTFYALTDRYVKFWNILAKKLKKEYPNRDVNVGVYAYHATQPAPTIPLEKNVIPEFVGIERRSYKNNNQENTKDQWRMWKGWWEAAGKRNSMFWRPNIIYRTLGLPYIFTKRHTENMHFLAEHGLAGVDFDSSAHWATQGPQLYLMAELNWNPRLSRDEILDDYYKRGFGPAAPFIEQYYQNFEDLYKKLAEQYKDQGYHAFMDPPRLFRQIRLDSKPATGRLGKEGISKHYWYEKESKKLLNKATEAVANSDVKYQDRVQFAKTGFDFIQAQLDTIEAVNDYRDEHSEANFKRAQEAAARREAIVKESADTFAVNQIQLLSYITGKRAKDLAPPKEQ